MTTYELQPDGTLREVADPPTRADLVHVVRCRDCIFALGTLSKRAKTFDCMHFITIDRFENPVPSEVEPDGFCAWGKRREDA